MSWNIKTIGNKIKNALWYVHVWIIISSISSFMIYAQSVDEIFNKFVKKYQAYQDTTIPYYVFIPEVYNSQIQYPLVLCLHGAGERGDNPSAVKLNSMAIVWGRDSNQTRWPCFIFVPQCPDWWANPDLMETVNDILESLIVEFSIDTNRLYITGLSMGGNGTWEMLFRYPNKFAAAVPMSGWGDPSKAELIKHIPIWNFHGAMDNVVSVSASRALITALENAGNTVVYTYGLPDSVISDTLKKGAKHLYTEYEFGGHSIWDQSYNNGFLLPWVFSQSKVQESTGMGRENFTSFPKEVSLSQNYPNPFNPSTSIQYAIGSRQFVTLKIYDILGSEVTTLINEEKQAGNYKLNFNGSNLSSGIYVYTLIAGSYSISKKIILMK